MRTLFILIALPLVLAAQGASGAEPAAPVKQTLSDKKPAEAAEWTSLLNGKDLAGWTATFGPRVEGVDSANVFEVVELDGEPVLRVSGEMLGGLATVKSFDNYHLQLQFKWGDKRFAPRADLPRDSGLLYHGTDSVSSGSGWIESIEFGILEGGETGDFWSVAGEGDAHIVVDLKGEEVPADKRRYPEQHIRYRAAGAGYTGTRSGVLNGDDNELPRGEWNTLDLVCLGDTSLHAVNGSVNMVLTNIRRVADGRTTPHTAGRLQLQSEGAETYFRNIRLRPITAIPAELARAAAAPPANTLTDAERKAGWRLLFDGRSTDGWRGYRSDTVPAGWQAIGEALTRVAKAGDLITREQFDDFELSLDWKISAGGNSGIFYRAAETEGGIHDTAPEYEIRDNAYWLDDPYKTGANYGLHAYDGAAARPVGYWNTAQIIARGKHIEHWLNGQRVAQYVIGSDDWQRRLRESKYGQSPNYATASRGHIGLQDHDAQVWFRNIKLRPLAGD